MSNWQQWIVEHLPEGIAMGLLTIIGWFTKREVNRLAKTMGEVPGIERRLANMEANRVTREDFDELRQSMNATFTNGIDRIEKTQNIILECLLNRDSK